jgi:hypothetical protein
MRFHALKLHLEKQQISWGGKNYRSLIHRKVTKEAGADIPTAVTMNSTVY